MNTYYYSKDDEQYGPVSLTEMSDHKIYPETLVWREGMKKWIPAIEVPEVRKALGFNIGSKITLDKSEQKSKTSQAKTINIGKQSVNSEQVKVNISPEKSSSKSGKALFFVIALLLIGAVAVYHNEILSIFDEFSKESSLASNNLNSNSSNEETENYVDEVDFEEQEDYHEHEQEDYSDPFDNEGEQALIDFEERGNSNSQDFYIVGITATEFEEEAEDMARNLRKSGSAADYLWIPDYKSLSGAEMFVVYIGPFYDVETCAEVVESYRESSENIYGVLVSNSSSRVEIYGIDDIRYFDNSSQENQSKNNVNEQSRQFFETTHVISDPDGWAFLRKSPGGDTLMKVDNDTACKVLSKDGAGWWRVELKTGETGYIHSSRLKTVAENDSGDVFKVKILDNLTYVNVRSKPMDGDIIQKVSGREIFTVTQRFSEGPQISLLKEDTTFETGFGKLIEKPKDFKVDELISDGDGGYFTFIEDDQGLNYKVDISLDQIVSETSEWYYLSELDGWILSKFCERI